MACQFCEKDIPMGLAICPYCGKPQSAPGEDGRRFLWFILAVVAMFGIAIAEHYIFFSH